MRRFPYTQLDVFTARPFGGNQLAVFFDADALEPGEMQAMAREMNFSESTFVLAPGDPTRAVRRIRIFTPAAELPFAGHPVIGTSLALALAGIITPADTTATLELGIGPLKVEPLFVGGAARFIWMNQPAPVFTAWPGDRVALLAGVGLDENSLRADLPLVVGSAGVPHLLVPLRDSAELALARHGAGLAAALAGGDPHIGVYLYVAPEPNADGLTRARMFAPGMGIIEDAATGSAAGPLGAYLALRGVAPVGSDGRSRLVIAQGVEMGRPSEITVETRLSAGAVTGVRVGGTAVVVATGEFILPDADNEVGL
ncbi:MAG TPA: PhzF family phenazine biosynthesis protein [Ktedonobacterales bacterium]